MFLVEAIFMPFPPQTGTNMLHPRPPQSLKWSPAETNSNTCSVANIGNNRNRVVSFIIITKVVLY